MTIVLDTSAVSLLMRRESHALKLLKQHQPGAVYLTTAVAAEIAFGLERLPPDSRKRRNLEREYRRLREAVRWCDWTEAAAAEFGRQKARLAASGLLIEDMDLIVGSVALALEAGVATANRRHFERLSDLIVEDWGASGGQGD